MGLSTLIRRIDRLSDRRFALLAMTPAGLLITFVLVPPILAVFGMSLFRIALTKDDLTPFVGLTNYTIVMKDREFLDAIPRTLAFAALTTALTIPMGLAAALLLKRARGASTLLLVATLLPWAVAPIATGIFWKFMFQSRFGLMTTILNGLGLADGPINWLDESTTALVIAAAATTWRAVPLVALLLLAALRAIPENLYRAAKADGATNWQCFRHITLPSIRGMLLVVGILEVILSLQVFDILFTLTGGGPGRQTTMIVYYIFENAFRLLTFGYASAITVLLFGLISAFALALFMVRRRRDPRVGRSASARPSTELDDLQIAPPPVRATARRATTRRRRRTPRWLGTVGVGIAMSLLVVWFVGPIAWMAIASVQPESAITSVPPNLTAALDLRGFAMLLGDERWLGSLAVSLQTAIGTTIGTMVLAVGVAYPLARLDVPGKGAVLTVLLATQMVPAIVMAIPVLLMFQAIHLKDTVASLVLVNVAFSLPLVVWLVRNAISEIPFALEAAARMDGCSRLGAVFRVTLPAASPAIAATAILVLISTWNDFLFAVILGDRSAVTVTRRITFIESFFFSGSANNTPPYHLLAAGAMVAVIPCLVLVAIFAKRITGGLTGGFVKG